MPLVIIARSSYPVGAGRCTPEAPSAEKKSAPVRGPMLEKAPDQSLERVGHAEAEEPPDCTRLMHGRVVGGGIRGAVGLDAQRRPRVEQVEDRAVQLEMIAEGITGIQVEVREVVDVAPVAKTG